MDYQQIMLAVTLKLKYFFLEAHTKPYADLHQAHILSLMANFFNQ